MRIEGVLSKWNDDRGFGFITPARGGQEVFVYISAFPSDGVRPTLGERVSFEIETDKSGKRRAKTLLCPQRTTIVHSSSRRSSPSYRRKDSPGFFGRAIPLLILVSLGTYGYAEYSRRVASLPAVATEPEVKEASSPYRCDGRTHCAQMTSCREATFFLRNCPNTELDGDHDGVPCEQQWCTIPFTK